VDCTCNGIAEKLCMFLVELFEISDSKIVTGKYFLSGPHTYERRKHWPCTVCVLGVV
jgi:hypothetical protein